MYKKERILCEAYRLMSKIGPQSMTMDMVAHNCGVSKRTLYEQFGGKTNLIKEALIHANTERMNRAKTLYDGASNSFEALLEIFLEMRELFRDVSDVVLFDVKRLYPDLLEDFKRIQMEHVGELAEVIDRAKAEGLALDAIDSREASFLLFVTMSSLRDSVKPGECDFEPREMFDLAFVNFIRGIATEKGREFVDNFLVKNLKRLK